MFQKPSFLRQKNFGCLAVKCIVRYINIVTKNINKMGKPTLDMYAFVQAAFDHFNNELFNSQLPQPMLSFQREKRVFGYFAASRWQDGSGGKVHEIALNPMYFITHKPLELMQTIVHEMCHLWQHEFGTPSRTGYHNKEWADKMEAIGLMPSSTGQPGGKRVGQQMSDYPLPGGRFYQACVSFAAAGHQLPFVDAYYAKAVNNAQIRQISETLSLELNQAFSENSSTNELNEVASLIQQALATPFTELFDLSANEELNQAQQQMAAKKTKVCYQCPECGIKLWGKPNLSIICGECQLELIND